MDTKAYDKKTKLGLFDSHAHYDDERFNEDRQELLTHINDSGVDFILNASSSMESSQLSVGLAQSYDFIYASVGVHPHEVQHMTESDIEVLRSLSAHNKVRAIGEIGLDYYHDHSDRESQKLWFAKQIVLAHELELPIIVHDRDSHEDVLRIMTDEKAWQLGGVLHCFSGSVDMAKTVIDNGFYISVGGPVTFKNARKVVEVIEYVPLDRLLIETDCPYLSPEPFRGKRNHSGHLAYVAQKIADIKGVDFEQAVEATTSNAKKLFGIG